MHVLLATLLTWRAKDLPSTIHQSKAFKGVFCVFDIELTSKAQSFSFGGLSVFKTVRGMQDLQGSKTSSPSHANFASWKHCCKCKVRRLMKHCLKR